MQTIPAGARFDLTEAQWAVLEPLLPVGAPGRPAVHSRRRMIDAVRWRVRVGAPWRDVPERYGPWQSVYSFFRRWQLAGVWAMLVTALQSRADASGLITWDVSVDSTIVRAHQHAAGARRDLAVRGEPDDHGLGRSRGGWSTKLHLACEQGRRLMSLVLTGGQRGDKPTVRRSPQAYPRTPHWSGPPAHPPGSRAGRQGLRVPGQPRLPAPTRDPGHHPDQGGPSRQPA